MVKCANPLAQRQNIADSADSGALTGEQMSVSYRV